MTEINGFGLYISYDQQLMFIKFNDKNIAFVCTMCNCAWASHSTVPSKEARLTSILLNNLIMSVVASYRKKHEKRVELFLLLSLIGRNPA